MNEDDIAEYVKLKYLILQSKFIYYTTPLDKKGKEIRGLPDSEYDQLEFRYKELHQAYGFGSPDVSEMVGWDPDSRDARFAMMMVYVNAMSESEFQHHHQMIFSTFGDDISVFRD